MGDIVMATDDAFSTDQIEKAMQESRLLQHVEAGEGPRDQFIMGDETCGQQKKFIVEGSLLLIVDNE